MSKEPRDVVIAFCDAWDRRNVEDVLAHMAPDIEYQNVPLPAMYGRDEAAKFLVPILKNTTKIEFRLLSIAVSASSDEVLTERLDRLHFPTGVIDIPLMGIFAVRDGKITEWRDYSDNGSAMEAFTKARIDLTKPDFGLPG
ncbi:MAG TPA: limonene-1,2-epoxide hydrolase family protein [Allosphingosinicella sp.]|nr:limonene-1,2-epoxide hydrolase family protein [Allosphingosinicella sp.]